jgi:hypothetical protein
MSFYSSAWQSSFAPLRLPILSAVGGNSAGILLVFMLPIGSAAGY